jgi:uncharacterized repeat protein (TIGR03803 family)
MRIGNVWLFWVAVIVSQATSGINTRAQAFGVLHSFTGSTTDGSTPEGQPLLLGSTLYGVTYYGGSNSEGTVNSDGTVYQISTNGTGFSVVYSFAGGTNGDNPYCTLVSAGSVLYGMTFNGGVDDGGVIFGVNTNGPVYNLLHIFRGGDSDGQYPLGSLTLAGSTLYGMTDGGGTDGVGVVFEISTSGTNFSVIHSFAGGVNDGEFPNEGVVLGGTALYGTTFNGGSNNLGIVFADNTALTSNAFSILHHFAGGTNDGANPTGPLALSGSTLYGLATAGGTNNLGVVFKISTNGTGYSVLHSFAGGTNDGASPQFGPLVVTNSVVYGATEEGGVSNSGVVFQINTDGTGFTVVHAFSGGANDGAFPSFGPLLSGSVFYGTTVNGGSNKLGVVYGAPVSNIATVTCTDATNVLTQVSAIEIVGNSVVITVPTVICDMYQLQYTDEMVPTNWITTGSIVPGTGSPIQFVEPIASCSAEGTCLPPASGLVSWWPGDGNALDIVGGNNGVLSNGATFAAGEVCQAFSFTNNYAGVVVGNPPNLQLTNFTIETWFRLNNLTATSTDPTCGGAWLFGYGQNGYGLLLDGLTPGSEALSLTQTGYNHIDVANAPSIDDTNWHHAAVTWSGTAAVFYQDGEPYASGVCSAPTCFNFVFNTPAAIGIRGDHINGSNNCAFNGDIDEVSVYNRVLTAREIQSIYVAGAAGKCKPSLLQRFYRVQESP